MIEFAGGQGAVSRPPGDAIPAPDGIFGAISASSVTSSPNLPGSLPNLPKNIESRVQMNSNSTPIHLQFRETG